MQILVSRGNGVRERRLLANPIDLGAGEDGEDFFVTGNPEIGGAGEDVALELTEEIAALFQNHDPILPPVQNIEVL